MRAVIWCTLDELRAYFEILVCATFCVPLNLTPFYERGTLEHMFVFSYLSNLVNLLKYILYRNT